MWLCDVCVSLQHNKGCQASGFLFASLLCYHSPVSPNFLSHRMQITRPLFREVFVFLCVFLFLFCGKLHKGACILTTVSYSTLLCNGSKAVGDTVTCLFGSNQARSVNTSTLVLHSLKTKTTVWLVTSNDDIPNPPPVWILIHFQSHSRQVVLSFVPFQLRSIIKTQITELCWNWS